MTTYIVKEKNELHIYQIRDDQKDTFLADYGPRNLHPGRHHQVRRNARHYRIP